MMRQQYGLGPLQVRVTGNNRIAFLLREGNQRALQVSNLEFRSADFRDEPQPNVGGDLVIATASRVQLLARCADLPNQRRLNVHVDVFAIKIPLEFAGFNLALNGTQAALDLGGLGLREQTYL